MFHENLSSSQIQMPPMNQERLLTSSTKIADDLENEGYDIKESQALLNMDDAESEELMSQPSVDDALLPDEERSDTPDSKCSPIRKLQMP